MSQTIYDTTPMRQVFKEGTWDVKLSFLVMGLANLVNKQFTKGLLFLLSEIAFLVAFVIQIIPALKGMITLGTQEQGEAQAVREGHGADRTGRCHPDLPRSRRRHGGSGGRRGRRAAAGSVGVPPEH